MAKNFQLSFPLKIISIAVVVVGAFVYITFGLLLPLLEENLYRYRKEMVKHLLEPMLSSLQSRQQQVDNAELTLAEAQQRALDRLRSIRFGEKGKDYYWILDTRSKRLIMHPYLSQLEGAEIINYKDSDGKQMFVEMLNIADSPSGEGFLQYRWQKNDDPDQNEPKLSYVKLFKPWGWLIGTGVYVNDIQNEINHFRRSLIIITGIVLLIVLLGVGGLAYQAFISDRTRKQKEAELQKSLRNFQALFELLPFSCVINDMQGRTLMANQHYCKVVHLTSEEICGKKPKDLNQGYGPGTMNSLLQELQGTGKISAGEVPISTPDGTRWVLISSCPIDWQEERAILTATIDITDRKNAEKDLQASEKKYRTIFQSDCQAFFLMDSLLYIDCNEQACRVWQCERNDILGHTLLDFSPVMQPDGRTSETAGRTYIDAAQGGNTQRFYWQHKRKDNTLVDCDVTLTPIDIHGQSLLLATVTDITDRKEAERQLEKERIFSESLINHSPAYVIVLSRSLKILRVNHAFCMITGYRADELLDADYVDFFIPPESREKMRLVSTKIIENYDQSGDGFWTGSNPILTRSGELRHIQWSGNTLKIPSVEDIVILCVGLDLTEQHKLQEQMHHIQKMESIGQLAGGVAHDFNNMLGGIIGAAELIQLKTKKGEPSDKYLGMILDSAERAASLTDKLLSFARKQPTASTTIDINLPVQDAISLLQSTVDKRIRLHSSLSEVPIRVVGDPSQIQNAVLNLLINASHAMPEGGDIFTSSRVTELDERYCQASGFAITAGLFAEVEIRDTGCGIPPEYLGRIFEPFFTTKDSSHGTGLGLAAVFGTIQQHKGAITVYSEVGSGTCFHILLPLSDEPIQQTETTLDEAFSGQGTILIVDDENIMRSTAGEILQQHGYNILLAEDGKQGLALYRQEKEHIDLVILDMVMPEMNGRDCFMALREINPDVRVILSSGFSREDEIQPMKASGLKGFIRKPFRNAVLCKVVKDALSQSSMV